MDLMEGVPGGVMRRLRSIDSVLMRGLAGGMGLAVILLDLIGRTGLDTIIVLLGIGLFMLAWWSFIAEFH
jgi:hypothetical protein